MKKILLVLVVLLVLFVGCEMNDLANVDVVDMATSVFEVGTDEVASGDIRALSSSRSVVSSNGLKLSFRSSDIEFWSTNGDYSNLVSKSYVDGTNDNIIITEDMNVSKTIRLSDTPENVTFMPNNVHLEKGFIMPAFDLDKVYDIVRMDIGSGMLSLTMNGKTVGDTYDYNTESWVTGDIKLNRPMFHDSAYIDANSIILVDKNVMTNTHYLSRSEMNEVNTHDYGVDDAFIEEFILNKSNSEFGWTAGIDMDGALFLPFDSVDFAGKNSIKNIHIKLKWDMDSVLNIENDNYSLRDSADGTPFNFDVSIEIF